MDIAKAKILLLAVFLMSSLPISANSFPQSEKTAKEWRAAGARPAMMVVAKDGEVDAAEKTILRQLLNSIGKAQTVNFADGTTLSVTPAKADKELLGHLIDGSNVATLYEKDARAFIQIVLLTPERWQTFLKFKASKYWKDRNKPQKKNSDVDAMDLMNPRTQTLQFLGEGAELNTYRLLEYKAWQLVSRTNHGMPIASQFEHLRPECDKTADGC